MIIAYVAASAFAGAGMFCLGKARGFKEGVQRVFHDLEDTGTCHGLDHIAVGYVYSESEYIRGDSKSTPDVQTGTMDKSTSCELGNMQHAAEVAIVGVHRATYEHPFLSVGNIG